MTGKRTAEEDVAGIGTDGDESDGSEIERPRKSIHRQRAHNNPLATNRLWCPDTPASVPVAEYYPGLLAPSAAPSSNVIRWVDLGCGFGSLILELARVERRELILGMELRHKPTLFVQKRIVAQRKTARAALPHAQRGGPVECDNAWAVEANSMKCMPNYFAKGQLSKLFICFPDPHFKKRNVRRRVVSTSLLAEYAYCLGVGARLYTITDVSELTDWMVDHLTRFPLFRRLPNEDLAADPIVALLLLTDEGLKVTRNNGNMFIAVFERLGAPKAAEEPVLPREVSAAAAAAAGYTPKPGGELRGKTW